MKIFFRKNNTKKGFPRLVDFGDAISSRAKSASPKLTTGFMMVEVLIATSIIVILMVVAMNTVGKGISISNQTLHATQASYLLEEGAEATRIFRDNTWSNISNLTVGTAYYPYFNGSTWVLQTSAPSPSQTGIFSRTVVLSSVNRNATTGDIATSGTNDPGTKLVTVNVSWPESGQTISKSLSFYISNIFQ
jgi:Tfp pilus assembly protein PilV